MQRNGLTYEDIASKNTEKLRTLYREETPVFSYYIVKSILLYSANDFIEWTMIHNRGSINFYKTPYTVRSYIDFITKHSENPQYRTLMDMTEKCIGTTVYMYYALKTMRMTVHED